jgi:hypothetical protein
VKALALDPGKTTGYAVAYVGTDGTMDIEVGEEQFSLNGLYEFIDAFIGVDESHRPANIIYEDFSYRNASRAGLDLTPVKMIGIIEMYKEKYEPFIGFHLQSAATGKAFWSDDKLKAKGIHAKGRKHGRDATRHLMQWLTFGPGSKYANVDELSYKLEVV